MTEHVDCVVIGAGVVGLACAATLANAGREVLVLESAGQIGSGTSSRNSEVIHAGIYYEAGSLKARLCREGRDRLYAYASDRGVPYKRLGKLIVSQDAGQQDRLAAIHAAAAANEVGDLQWLTRADIARLEPDIAAPAGLFSPSTGIIDSHALMLGFEGDLTNAGGMVVLNAHVAGGRCDSDGIIIEVGGSEPIKIKAACVVNAAGLHAPAVAASLAGVPRTAIPPMFYAIGHYYRMTGRAPFQHLVYPVPEGGGLGVHLTLDMGGQAKFGPDVRWIDAIDYRFDDSRFDAFVAAIRSYFPTIEPDRLSPDYTGIRPKLVGPGAPAADFRIDDAGVHGVQGLVNLFGIESPGLTASIAIGEYVAGLVRRYS